MNVRKISRKSLYPFVLTIILIILLTNSVKSISKLKSGIRRIDDTKEKIAQLQEENSNIHEKIKYAQSDEYIEKASLEELNLTKPDMNILIIDPLKPENQRQNNEIQEKNTNNSNYMMWLLEFKFL